MLPLLAVLALAIQLPASQPGMVWGQVRSESSGAPLRYAVVEIPLAGRENLRTETDENGIYILRDVPTGRRLLRATHIDHAPLNVEVVVPSGGHVALDFGLRLRPVELPFVLAQANGLARARTDTTPARAADLTTAAVRALESTPGVAELGLADVAQDIPGSEPIDPSDVLYVRGGAADLKLVLLDGAPVYAPFHLGGLISALETDWLREATLYLGGAPARYDGGLSYVLDLESRSGRTGRTHAEASADLLAAHARVEGPIVGGAAYLIGARTVHGIGAEPFFRDVFPYNYGDALARLDVPLGNGNLSATGFWNEESVRLDSTARGAGVAEWGNRAGSLRFRGRLFGSTALLTVAGGTFTTGIPLGGIRSLVTEARSARGRVAADFERSLGPVRFAYGGSIDRLTFDYSASAQQAGADSVLLRAHGEGDSGGAYVDFSFNVVPGLRVRTGLRGDAFALIDDVRMAPRFSTTLALGERAALTLAAGRYHQYVRASEEEIIFVGSVVRDTIATPPMTVARGSHLAVQLAQDLGDAMYLGLEGYYKHFQGLPSTVSDEAEASGLELSVRRAGERISGWFGYSLAWVWSTDRDRYAPDPRPFAGRHLISAGVSGPIIGTGAFDVRVAYGSGLPYTAIPEPEGTPPVFAIAGAEPAVNASAAAIPSTPRDEPDEPYLRVDARVAHTWSGSVQGVAFDVTPYLRLLNALNRRDAIFYHFDRTPAGTELRPLAALPVLPILGLEWRF
jgi:hypothetical protein